MEIDILIEDPAWAAAGLPGLVARGFGAVAEELTFDPNDYELSILACDDTRIAGLNTEFRGKPAPTNVLSWPATEIALPEGGTPPMPPSGPLGDVAIAFGVCETEAAQQGKPFADHVTHLIVHALLHLLGYDHIGDADAAVMEDLERRILARLGVPDPY